MQHERAASQNRQLFASENHGRPPIAAAGRAGEFSGRNAVAAREAGEPYRAPRMSPQEARVSSSESPGTEERSHENNRDAARNGDREEQGRDVVRNNSYQSKPEQKQQQIAEKAKRKQAQQNQKRQQQEQKRSAREERGPGR